MKYFSLSFSIPLTFSGLLVFFVILFVQLNCPNSISYSRTNNFLPSQHRAQNNNSKFYSQHSTGTCFLVEETEGQRGRKRKNEKIFLPTETLKSDRLSLERKSKMLNESLILPQQNTHKKFKAIHSEHPEPMEISLQDYNITTCCYIYMHCCEFLLIENVRLPMCAGVCVFLYISKKLEGKNWKQELSENRYSCVIWAIQYTRMHSRTHAHRYSSLQKVHTQVP